MTSSSSSNILESSSSTSKKKKKTPKTLNSSNENGSSSIIDRISELPEGVLHHIFSFLNMEQVIQTSLLSRRWRFFWTTFPTLNFNRNLVFGRDRKKAIEEMVDQVLLRRENSSSITRFELYCVQADHLDPWIIYACTHNVQELIVDFGVRKLDRFPFRLFTCSSLKVLKLINSRYGKPELLIPDLATLPQLETLRLDGFTCSEDDINDKLFSSVCPNLEYLDIVRCIIRSTNVSISSDKLKHLGLSVSFRPRNKVADVNIKLNAPNLISFQCEGYLMSNYWFGNIASVVKADINLWLLGVVEEYSKLHYEKKKMYGQRAMTLLKAVLNVVEDTNEEVKSLEEGQDMEGEVQNVKDKILGAQSLKLSAETLEIISGCSLLEEKSPSRFSTLRSLELTAYSSRDSLIGMMYMLNISPNIESIVIQVNEVDVDSANAGNYKEPGLPFDCWLNHLKSVRFRSGSVRGLVDELKILEILLKNAIVLERLTIDFINRDDSPDRKRAQITFYEKLLTFPKASSHVTILRRYIP